MANHLRSVVLALLVALLACETAKTSVAKPGSQAFAAAVRKERPTSQWDTAWMRLGSSTEATLVVRVSPAGIHVFDPSEKQLTLISRTAETLWQFGGKINAARQLGEIRDLDVDAFGRSYLLDAQNEKIIVVDSLGHIADEVSTRSIGRAEQLVVLGSGRYLLHTIGRLRFPILSTKGTVEGYASVTWPGLSEVQPIARQLVTGTDPKHGRWVLAALVGNGWIVSQGTRSTTPVYPYLEVHPLPAVRTTSIGTSTYTSFVRYTGCTACDVAVADSSFYMLSGGTAESAKQVIDRYDLRTGKYLESFRFSTRLQSFAVDGGRLYVVTEDPATMLVALDQRR